MISTVMCCSPLAAGEEVSPLHRAMQHGAHAKPRHGGWCWVRWMRRGMCPARWGMAIPWPSGAFRKPSSSSSRRIESYENTFNQEITFLRKAGDFFLDWVLNLWNPILFSVHSFSVQHMAGSSFDHFTRRGQTDGGELAAKASHSNPFSRRECVLFHAVSVQSARWASLLNL